MHTPAAGGRCRRPMHLGGISLVGSSGAKRHATATTTCPTARPAKPAGDRSTERPPPDDRERCPDWDAGQQERKGEAGTEGQRGYGRDEAQPKTAPVAPP